MKPPPFEYYAPETIKEALTHLAEHGYDAKVLAGGQSLIPMMNFRLAFPEVLIDLNNIANLAFINRDDNGGLRLGAMTRHAQVERDPLVSELAPLIYEAMPKIATSQIRSRGTFGGSIAHADPSAELVAVSVALEGRFRLVSQNGERWFSANEFFLGMFTTQIEPEELLVEIAIPPLPSRSGWSLIEVARRPHDFAMVGVTAVVTMDDQDRCQRSWIVYLSVGDGPVEGHHASEMLSGQTPTPDLIRAAAEKAAAEDVDPSSDIHASAAYRRHLVNILTGRALDQAFQRARNHTG